MAIAEKQPIKGIRVEFDDSLRFEFSTENGTSSVTMQLGREKDKYFTQLIRRAHAYNCAQWALEKEQAKGLRANPIVLLWQWGRTAAARRSLPIGLRP